MFFFSSMSKEVRELDSLLKDQQELINTLSAARTKAVSNHEIPLVRDMAINTIRCFEADLSTLQTVLLSKLQHATPEKQKALQKYVVTELYPETDLLHTVDQKAVVIPIPSALNAYSQENLQDTIYHLVRTHGLVEESTHKAQPVDTFKMHILNKDLLSAFAINVRRYYYNKLNPKDYLTELQDLLTEDTAFITTPYYKPEDVEYLLNLVRTKLSYTLPDMLKAINTFINRRYTLSYVPANTSSSTFWLRHNEPLRQFYF